MKRIKQSLSGIAGVFHVEESAKILYFLLHSIQHRGQDGAGMAISDGNQILSEKKHGLLSEIFTEDTLHSLPGNASIGQVRMAMEEDRHLENLQPIMVRAHQGHFGIVTTGSILNAQQLLEEMEEEGLIFQGVSDAELIAHLIQRNRGHLFEKIMKATEQIIGSYTFLLMTKNTMYALRSFDGIHTLFMAEYKEGYVFGSESSAFSMLDVKNIRELKPGELIRLGKGKIKNYFIDPKAKAHPCAMEYVYYSREDSTLDDQSVHEVRKAWGEKLALKEDVEADLVIGVPDTALSAAMQFAQTLKKPYEIGLIKNRYIGSTYIKPSAIQREQGIRTRLNAISSIVKGKKIYLVDDSLVKGFTAKRLCQLMKEAGAKEVHLRIASSKIFYSCPYGYSKEESSQLAAHQFNDEEMCQLFGADSIRFLSIEEFMDCLPVESCTACMTGKYPIKEREGK